MQQPNSLGVIIGKGGKLSSHVPFFMGFHSYPFISLDRHQTQFMIEQMLLQTPLHKTFALMASQTKALVNDFGGAHFEPLDHYSKITFYLAVNDGSIFDVHSSIIRALEDLPKRPEVEFVHFSGALSFDGIIGVHPLMTFTGGVEYSDEVYKSLTLKCDNKDFANKYPSQLSYIDPRQKTLYHSLCVMLGNFPQLLIDHVFKNMPPGFNSQDFHDLIIHSVLNVLDQGEKGLTGPLVRKDFVTIERHLKELQGGGLEQAYSTLTNLFLQEGKDAQPAELVR